MFPKSVYVSRRKKLKAGIKSGVILILGNSEASMNYPDNTYHFRQDSNFLYFFGLDHPDLAGVMDVDNNRDYVFGNDVDMDDIIWMGPQPSMKARAEEVGVEHTAPFSQLADFLSSAIKAGRRVHFLPPYRGEQVVLLKQLLGFLTARVKDYVSQELIKGVIRLRSYKDPYEIKEIEKALDISYKMFTTAMKMAKPGVMEYEIAGAIEGIALAHGGRVAFPIILSINGQTLHNHKHGNKLVPGRMLVIDAGAECPSGYASDITRTVPVGGKFNQKQKDIYQIVLNANLRSTEAIKPGMLHREAHLIAARTIASGLKELGLMKGNVDEAVAQGAHALFFPHGLGHMMGLDVHDMEGLGENNVGYDETIVRSTQFGLAFLRLAKKLEPGFVMTNEPGIYFIPELIAQWKAEKKFMDFINYQNIEPYMETGGIRIEDDILVTETGYRVLGRPIPKTIEEVTATVTST